MPRARITAACSPSASLTARASRYSRMPQAAQELNRALRAAGLDTRVASGRTALVDAVREPEVDVVMAADRRCRGTALDPRGRGRRPARAARQQGIPGCWRGAACGGRACGGRHADPHRQRTQRDLPVPARMLDDRDVPAPGRAPNPAHRVGRPLPAALAREHGPRHPGRSLRPSALAHGTEDLRRLGDSHEQGTGADRGLRAVRDGTTAGRSGRTSAEHRAFDGGVRGRIGPGSARQSGHAHTDRARPGLAGSHRVRCRIAGPGRGLPDWNSRRRTSSAFRRCGWRAWRPKPAEPVRRC